jgi:hypothetical protein
MRRDHLGNPVGALHDSTLRGIDDFVAGLLGYETRAERILAAADAEPGSCIANAYAGLLWMLLEAPAADPNGAPLNAALAGVYDELGLPELGRRARERAMLTRARHPD